MANSVTIQLLEDGPRNVVVKFEGVLDTSDLASTVVIAPATLSPIDSFGNPPAQLRIDSVQYTVEDLLSVNLFWDATTPVRIEEFVGRGVQKPFYFGGLTNNAGAGKTGKITATTQGWVAGAVLSFTLIIKMVKQSPTP